MKNSLDGLDIFVSLIFIAFIILTLISVMISCESNSSKTAKFTCTNHKHICTSDKLTEYTKKYNCTKWYVIKEEK